MGKILKSVLAIIITMFFLTINIFASSNSISISELIDKGKEYDYKTVSVQGEVIGEMLERGENCFVNINDGTSAIGIYMKNSQGEMIKVYGDYHNNGDIINVKGTFNRACPEHGGDMDIHCDNMDIVSMGEIRIHEIDRWKIGIIIALFPFIMYASLKVFKVIRKK